MIIIKLIGGLGNQMFQYAAGKRAVVINKTELKLDTSWFKNPEGAIKRDYLLNVFNIKETFATPDEIRKLKRQSNNFFFKHFPRLISKTIPYYRQSYIKQRYFHFDPNILTIKDDTYLEGYWSSEKYFKDTEKIIRKDFTFKSKPDDINQKMINQMKNYDSVSIHIRRGDYVNDKKTNQFHGVCNLDYYFKAVGLIAKKVKNPQFFVFSDDIEWAKQNLHLKFPCVYVDHNVGQKDYEDLRLMSHCQHNIIANSSFSWWGAWLNINKNKVVIAPKKWFMDGSINTKDLIPESWTKL